MENKEYKIFKAYNTVKIINTIIRDNYFEGNQKIQDLLYKCKLTLLHYVAKLDYENAMSKEVSLNDKWEDITIEYRNDAEEYLKYINEKLEKQQFTWHNHKEYTWELYNELRSISHRESIKNDNISELLWNILNRTDNRGFEKRRLQNWDKEITYEDISKLIKDNWHVLEIWIWNGNRITKKSVEHKNTKFYWIWLSTPSIWPDNIEFIKCDISQWLPNRLKGVKLDLIESDYSLPYIYNRPDTVLKEGYTMLNSWGTMIIHIWFDTIDRERLNELLDNNKNIKLFVANNSYSYSTSNDWFSLKEYILRIEKSDINNSIHIPDYIYKPWPIFDAWAAPENSEFRYSIQKKQVA